MIIIKEIDDDDDDDDDDDKNLLCHSVMYCDLLYLVRAHISVGRRANTDCTQIQ